jgi:hypothetical protein
MRFRYVSSTTETGRHNSRWNNQNHYLCCSLLERSYLNNLLRQSFTHTKLRVTFSSIYACSASTNYNCSVSYETNRNLVTMYYIAGSMTSVDISIWQRSLLHVKETQPSAVTALHYQPARSLQILLWRNPDGTHTTSDYIRVNSSDALNFRAGTCYTIYQSTEANAKSFCTIMLKFCLMQFETRLNTEPLHPTSWSSRT